MKHHKRNKVVALLVAMTFVLTSFNFSLQAFAATPAETDQQKVAGEEAAKTSDTEKTEPVAEETKADENQKTEAEAKDVAQDKTSENVKTEKPVSLRAARSSNLTANQVSISVMQGTSSSNMTQDQLDNFILGQMSTGRVGVSIVPATGETKDVTYTLRLPDYLAFKNVPPTGANYKNATVETDTNTNSNAKDNVLKVTVYKPENPNAPDTVSFSF